MPPTSTPIRKATSATLLMLALLLAVSVITGAPWWAIWSPLMALFIVSCLILLAVTGSSLPISKQDKADNVVDMTTGRPRQ